METVQIKILNPKAKKLLKNLEDLNLIKISSGQKKSDFSELLNKIREDQKEKISLDEITKEVEEVRKSRYEQ